MAAIGLLIAALLPMAVPAVVAQGNGGLKGPLASDRVIVSYAPAASRTRRSLAAASVEADHVERLSPIADDTVVIDLPPGTSVADAVRELRGRPGVVYAEPDYRLTIADASNDPHYTNGNLWGMYGSG